MIPTRGHCRLVCVAILLIFVFVLGCLAFVLSEFSGSLTMDDSLECGVVFGATVHRNNQPGPGIRRRVSAAATLYHTGRIDRVIMTGGKGSASQHSEASVMRTEAMRRGIDPDHILVEEEARSTWENLLYSQDLLDDCNGVVGISDGYHLARISQLVAKQGNILHFRTYSAGDVPGTFFVVTNVLRETFGVVYYEVIYPLLS